VQLSIFLIYLFVGTYRLSSHARLEAFVIQTKLQCGCWVGIDMTASGFAKFFRINVLSKQKGSLLLINVGIDFSDCIVSLFRVPLYSLFQLIARIIIWSRNVTVLNMLQEPTMCLLS